MRLPLSKWEDQDESHLTGRELLTIHYRFFAGCSQLSLSTFSLPERITGPEKRGAKSPAFEIAWALSVRPIWSGIGEEKAIPVEGPSGIPE